MSLGQNMKLCMILLISINLLALVRGQDNPYKCTSNGNYTRNSTYSANLNSLLNSLPSNISDFGFSSSSVGLNQDTANGLALCRADQTIDQCRTCVRSATREVLRLCPNQRQAIIWYEFCTLRYSDDPIHRTQTADPTMILRNTLNILNGEQFREGRARLLEDLRVQAANGSLQLKVSAGNRNTTSEAIYGLVQCAPDLSQEDCGRCLTDAVQTVGSCCDVSRGVRILAPNCNIRYELSSFYNETRLRELRVLLPPPPSPSPPPGTNGTDTRRKKDDNTTRVVIIIVVPIGVCLILAAIFLIKIMKRRPLEITETIDEIDADESLQYDFGKIRAATSDFADANKLGQGGFGAVYRGKLQNGEEIAVKRLSKESGQGSVQFKNEVLLMAKLQHRNLVRLLGFSMEGRERALVYELVQNASLDQFLFDPVKSSHLDWNIRYKIIGGIARGLMYLHEDSRLKIIHRDLKASNVLLDGDMNPKIADFGMARLFKQDETQGNTSRIVGTYGYMAPEYAMHGQFSIKSDVFSFGVLVLEIVSGKRNFCTQNGEIVEDLLSITWKNWQDGTAANMIDPMLMNGSGSMREMMRCIHIGLLCVQEIAAARPTMASVVLMLSSSTITLSMPSEPAFYMSTRFGPEASVPQKYDSKETWSNEASKLMTGVSDEGSSPNTMSVTELYPR